MRASFLACALPLLAGPVLAQEKKVYYHDPNVSPDGKKFVYAKEVKGKYGLYLYDLKSGREKLLAGG